MNRLIYLFKTFLVIGSTSFGGYMALISMMRERMVAKDKAIEDDLITEGVALALMLPGPVAVNVVGYTGFYLAGAIGAFISIVSVLLPSFLLVLLLTVVYFQAGSEIDFHSILLGIFPIVAGVIFSTGFSMGKKNCVKPAHLVIAVLSFTTLFFVRGYWSILLVLALAAVAGIVLFKHDKITTIDRSQNVWRPVIIAVLLFAIFFLAIFITPTNSVLLSLVKEFSIVSLSLFGGGYVMVPILKSTLVDQLHWVSAEEFIYGISIGQVTPGPILISSAFFGYKMAGVTGAIVATASIFLPSSLLMIILSGIFLSIKQNPIVQSVLVGIRPAVVGMIVYSGFSLFNLMTDANLFVSITLAAVTFWLVYKYNVNTALLIVAGSILGFLIY